MKKLFTLFAALCCTLFSVMAAGLSDGAVIKVGTTAMTNEDKDNFKPAGLTSGAISYDATTHTMTLNKAVITEPLYIDVSAGDYDFTINVIDKGNSICQGQTITGPALQFIGSASGNTLYIEGNENAQLDVFSGGSSATYAVLCGKTDLTELYDIDFSGGMRYNLNSHMANTAALKCDIWENHKCNFSMIAYKTMAFDAKGTDVGSNCEVISYDYSVMSEIEGYVYTTAYPVWVGSFRLNDAKPSLSSSDLDYISSGSITYDPEKKELILNGLKMTIPEEMMFSTDGAAIGINGSEPITIRTGNWGDCVIEGAGTSTEINGLNVLSSVTIDPNGNSITFKSSKHNGIYVKDALTIYGPNGGEVIAQGGSGGFYGDVATSKVHIDATTVKATGTDGSFYGFDLDETDVALNDGGDGFIWDDTNGGVYNSSSELVKGTEVVFTPTKYIASVEVDPAEGGTADILNGSTSLGNPAKFSGTEELTLKITPAANWKFDHWADLSEFDKDYKANPRKIQGSGTNVSYKAIVESTIPKHKVTIKVADGQETYGSVTPLFTEKECYEGADIELDATPNEGYIFDKWSDGGAQNHIVTVGKSDITYTAYFKADPNIFPIWVAGKQMKGNPAVMTNATNPNISKGSITYDSQTRTLILDNLNVEFSANQTLIIGDKDKKESAIKVELKGTNIITTYADGAILTQNVDVSFEGDGSIQTNSYYSSYGMSISAGKVTFNGVTATINGNSYGIKGDKGTETVVVRGSTLKVRGDNSGSIVNIASLTMNYCEITSPSGAAFNEANKQVEVSGTISKAQIVFTPQPTLRGEAVQEGTGTFTMKMKDGSGETFTNIGWFANGAEVNMTAKPASGFAFGRWMDDMNWGDEAKKDDWIPATREVTKSAGNETKTALFYKQPASNVVWYGINKGKFVQFKSREYGANVIESTTDASSITAGDFNGSQYYIAESGEIKRFNFASVTKDKDQVNYDKATKAADYTGTVYDVAWNFKENRLYAVMGDTKLYRLNANDQVLDEMGEFITGELKTKVTARALAIDATGKKYILSSTNKLYVVTKEDTKNKEYTVEPVGENGGDLDAVVVNQPQSLAFDHVNGELYWGSDDFIRIIDIKTAKSYIAGDLHLKKGYQGTIKALHRRDRKVTVAVEVADACKDMGTAIIGAEGETVEQSMMQGTNVTITAIPAEGYQFAYWEQKLDEDSADTPEQIKDNPFSFSASSITYVAYFEATQGIEDVQSGNVQCTKMLIDGHLYIIRDNRIYNVQGVRVK